MTIEEQLEALRVQILYHRKKAESYRRRAEAQDRIADGKVRIAAELGTGELPLLPEATPYPVVTLKGNP